MQCNVVDIEILEFFEHTLSKTKQIYMPFLESNFCQQISIKHKLIDDVQRIVK